MAITSEKCNADAATAGDPPTGGWQVSLGESNEETVDGGDSGRVAIRGGAVVTLSMTEASQWGDAA